jgi:drug/metabolite transporter (DMT)-like permease
MTRPWVRLGEPLSWIAVVLAATVVVLFALIGTDVVPSSEPVAFISFLAGLLAPVFAIVGYGLTKLSGNRVSRVTVMALVLGVIVALWPVLFFLAFSNRPSNV